MIWDKDKYGFGSTCIIDDGLRLKVNKSMTCDTWYGYVFGSKCITSKSEEQCKEVCEIACRNIIDRAYTNHVMSANNE